MKVYEPSRAKITPSWSRDAMKDPMPGTSLSLLVMQNQVLEM